MPLPAQPGKGLHSLLNELAVLNHTAIAFSPTLTSGVYPKNTDLTGALDVVLKRILKGTQFDFRVVHGKYYQVYMKPKPPKVIVPEPAPEPKPERVKMGGSAGRRSGERQCVDNVRDPDSSETVSTSSR